MNTSRHIRVFLSHSSKDKRFVHELDRVLISVGVSTYLDDRDIRIGEDIPEWIYRSIESATHLVYVISRSSVESDWVREELSLAKMLEKERKGIFILPVLVHDVELPPSVKSKRYSDFRGTDWANLDSSSPAVTRLLETLGVSFAGPKDGISTAQDVPVVQCDMEWQDKKRRHDEVAKHTWSLSTPQTYLPVAVLTINNDSEFSTEVRIIGCARLLWGKEATVTSKEKAVAFHDRVLAGDKTLSLKKDDSSNVNVNIEELCLKPFGYTYAEVTAPLSSLYPKMESYIDYGGGEFSYDKNDPLYVRYQNLPSGVEMAFVILAMGRQALWFNLGIQYFYNDFREPRLIDQWRRLLEPIGPIQQSAAADG